MSLPMATGTCANSFAERLFNGKRFCGSVSGMSKAQWRLTMWKFCPSSLCIKSWDKGQGTRDKEKDGKRRR